MNEFQPQIRPRTWPLWTLPRPVIVYLLAIELLVVVVLALFIFVTPSPTHREWLICGVLIVCGLTHGYLSRHSEEQRRSAAPGPHIDLTGIWTFPAVLLLPVPLMALVIIVIRVQRYLIARRPLFRFIFSTSSIVAGALASAGLAQLLGVPTWTSDSLPVMLQDSAVAVIVAAVYGVVQAVAVAGVVRLITPNSSFVQQFGSKTANLLEAMTLGLGAVVAVALAHNPFLVLVMVPTATVLNRITMLRQLEYDAVTDSLTGLLNRRGWLETAQRTLARSDQRAALLLLDLDYFKSINDVYGHVAGDDVLRAVADVLRENTRVGDVVGRWGGEEFIVLLPLTAQAEAQAIAERIRIRIREMKAVTSHRRGGATVIIDNRSASVGLGVSPDDAADLEALLKVTDAALYQAKESGRDQVCRALAVEPPTE